MNRFTTMLQSVRKCFSNAVLLNCTLSVATAVLLFLAFPKIDLFYLAWIAFLPLLYVALSSRPLAAFGYGMLAGVLAHIGILYWMFVTISFHTKSVAQGIFSLIFIALYVGFYTTGLWCLLLSLAKNSLPPLLLALLAAAFWASMDYLRAHVLTGFPWGLLGYSQWKFLPFIQIAEFTGIYGISFSIIFFNVTLFQSIKARRLFPFLGTLIVFLGLIAGGYGLMKRDFLPTGEPFTVAALQGNIDQEKKWNPDFQYDIQETFSKLILEAASHGPDLMVWPETAVPGYLPHDERLSLWVSDLARKTGTYHLIGAPYHNPKESSKYYNSSFLVSPDGTVMGWHRKVHLIPFGEFAPLRVLFPKLTMLNALGQFTPGLTPTVLPFPVSRRSTPALAGTPSGKDMKDTVMIHVGPTICSENLYGHIVRGFPSRGADILISQTNDAWFFLTSAPYQHFTMNVFRAIENRRMVLASGNTGITGVVEPTGRVRETIPLCATQYLITTLQPYKGITFYTTWGDVFAWLCLFCTFVITALFVRKWRAGRVILKGRK